MHLELFRSNIDWYCGRFRMMFIGATGCWWAYISVYGSLNCVSKKERVLGCIYKPSCDFYLNLLTGYGTRMMCLERRGSMFVGFLVSELKFREAQLLWCHAWSRYNMNLGEVWLYTGCLCLRSTLVVLSLLTSCSTKTKWHITHGPLPLCYFRVPSWPDMPCFLLSNLLDLGELFLCYTY